MPLRGTNHSDKVLDDVPYLKSLAELDAWAENPPRKLDGVLRYHPRSNDLPSEHGGKLLVCHDYKGGYTEKPSGLSYTFNFWSVCDTFVYVGGSNCDLICCDLTPSFSHHRVTIPPSSYITAAHRQGVKILGVLIFEGDSAADALRLLVGRLPSSPTGPAAPPSPLILPALSSLPVSPHYARLLAELAHQRGFDGYLLNFEVPLNGGVEQTRALSEWIGMLQREMEERVGAHAQTVWYDSVIITGQLRWQDRLNSLNLPFFLASTSFFTNYTWPSSYPALTLSYLLSLTPALLSPLKSAGSIFMGIDVWGRGTHGGGGLAAYHALEHIRPAALGLGAALFAPAWTWESAEDAPGWGWARWWARERRLWVGSAGGGQEEERVVEAQPPRREGEPPCVHGPPVPLASFFAAQAPPNPALLPFHTTFSPGVGRAWFVGGQRVYSASEDTGAASGAEGGTQGGEWEGKVGWWTDIDKQTSIGDLLWPRPSVSWDPEYERPAESVPLPEGTAELSFEDAWNGGSAVHLSFSLAPSEAQADGDEKDGEDVAYRSLWVPVQSLSVTPGLVYEASLVYKPLSDADLNVGCAVQALAPSHGVQASIEDPVQTPLASGWERLSLRFVLPSVAPGPSPTSANQGDGDVRATLALVLGVLVPSAFEPLSLSLLMGQINIYPARAPSITLISTPRISWAAYARAPRSGTAPLGTLTWELAAALPALAALALAGPEDPLPAWVPDTSRACAPACVYFNVYVQRHGGGGARFPGPEGAVWVGTTGGAGRARALVVERGMLPAGMGEGEEVRVYVQGVGVHGEVMGWTECAFVDAVLG